MEALANDYYEISKLIQEKNSEIKKLRESKNEKEESLVKMMMKNNIEKINLEGKGSLVLKSQINLKAINKEYIFEKLVKLYETSKIPKEPTELASCTADFLIDNRNKDEKAIIKILKRS